MSASRLPRRSASLSLVALAALVFVSCAAPPEVVEKIVEVEVEKVVKVPIYVPQDTRCRAVTELGDRCALYYGHEHEGMPHAIMKMKLPGEDGSMGPPTHDGSICDHSH